MTAFPIANLRRISIACNYFLDKIGFASAISSELDCIWLALFLPLLLKFLLSCVLKFLQSYDVAVPNTVKEGK